jgi:GR25 family glycosyltransferase involved in LPS biosynthesis
MVDLLTLTCPFSPSYHSIPKIVISLKEHGRKLDIFKSRYQDAGFDLQELFHLEGFNAKQMKYRPPMTLRQLDDMDQERYDHRFFNKPGGFGCYLSHVQAWKWCIDSGKPCLIFEDDAFFPFKRQTAGFINDKIQNVLKPQSNIVFLFGYNEIPGRKSNQKLPKHIPHKIVEVKNIFHGLQGYYVTPESAKFMLEKAFPIEMQVDSFMGLLAKLYPENFFIKSFSSPIITQSNVTGTSVQTKCTVCNGKINESRFKISSKREKDDFCEKTGICSKAKTINSQIITLAAAMSILLLKKRNR